MNKENNARVEIALNVGKYTYIREEGRGQHALRHGLPWRDLTGDGFVLAMAQEIEELREKLAVHGPATPDASPYTPVENERVVEDGEQPEAITAVRVDSVRYTWTCRIGSRKGVIVPPRADLPMRNAVSAAYVAITGEQPEAIFSGWGDRFSGSEEAQLAAVAGEEPSPVTPAPEQSLSAADLLATTDAAVWAREFCRIARNLGHEGIDEGWTITWFANAMAAQEIKTARERASQGDQ